MSDWEISAPDDATMQQLFNLCEIRKGDGFTSKKVRFSVNYYGTKVLSGVTQAGVYAIARWMPPNVQQAAFPPSGVTLPTGSAVTSLASASSPVIFFGG